MSRVCFFSCRNCGPDTQAGSVPCCLLIGKRWASFLYFQVGPDIILCVLLRETYRSYGWTHAAFLVPRAFASCPLSSVKKLLICHILWESCFSFPPLKQKLKCPLNTQAISLHYSLGSPQKEVWRKRTMKNDIS